MFWRRRKTSEYIDDSRFAPASETSPAEASPAAPEARAGTVPSGTPTLTVEDVFTITGRGLVATGMVAGGTLQVGQPVAVQRTGQVVAAAKISGLEVFRKLRDSAEPGENVGLLLQDVHKEQVQPGDQIVVTG